MLRTTLCILLPLAVLAVMTAPPLPAQDQDESSWSASVGARYLSRYTAYGVDLGNELPAAGYSLGLGHVSGLSLGVGAVQTLGSGGSLQNWSLSAGYDWEATDWFTLSAEFSHYGYENDSANVLAPLANSVSVGADLDFGPISFGLFYDTYLGTNSASYISANVSSFAEVGPVIIVPLAQMTFMSQTIEDRLLKTGGKTIPGGGGGGGGGTTTTVETVTTLTGLSSISIHGVLLYPVFKGLFLTIVPSYLYSPKSELSTSSSQFLWSAGLRYRLEF